MNPSQEEIARCAYLIWESEGCIHGRDVEYWIQAERQLIANYESAQNRKDDVKKKNKNKRPWN